VNRNVRETEVVVPIKSDRKRKGRPGIEWIRKRSHAKFAVSPIFRLFADAENKSAQIPWTDWITRVLVFPYNGCPRESLFKSVTDSNVERPTQPAIVSNKDVNC
jgi:hypothetical protein